MKKYISGIFAFLLLCTSLCSCTPIGQKESSLFIIYMATAVFSLLLLIGYCSLIKKKNAWFLLLFSSVFIVNFGYLCLSLSGTLSEALLSNRIAYLGSVFLPLSMLMILLNVTSFKHTKKILCILFPLAVFVFLVAASPGYLDIYYKSVSLETINGVTVLVKEYGPWHPLYLFYLVSYFSLMTAVIIIGKIKKKIASTSHAIILLIAVFVNICVWLTEQLVSIDFEMLSISYIISELFLLGVQLIVQDEASGTGFPTSSPEFVTPAPTPKGEITESSAEYVEKCKFLADNLHTLTYTESLIYNLYIDGKSSKEIMSEMNITENTLKYHNKNIYSKLGVSSRKQLIEYSKVIHTSVPKDVQ